MKTPPNSEIGRLSEAIRGSAPTRPGVYLFRSRSGETVYVGKSVNLKKRMLSYFRHNHAGLDRRTRQMVDSVHDFEFRETRSELLALLLEDALIKSKRPRYNIRQQQYLACRYIVLTSDQYPTCKVVDHLEAIGGRVFGPFKNRYLAERVLSVVNHQFGLRACTDPRPYRKSLNFDLGFCAGPCRSRVSEEEYAVIVRQAVEFLNGNVWEVVRKLRSEMKRSAAAYGFEKAATLKEAIDFCTEFSARQSFVRRFTSGSMTIRDRSDPDLKYRFKKGNLVAVNPGKANGTDSSPIPEELASALADARFLLDRAMLVYRWQNQDAGNGRSAPAE